MFKRVIVEEWTTWAPYVGFWVTFIVFLVLSVRAIRMKKDKVDHMANLPLEENGQTLEKNGNGGHA